MAFNIDPQLLRSDTNILQKIALIDPSLVLAGIWGATLSSALGGILGAPRILQAMSVDRVTPKVFGKGVGKSNEPRNALILTFIIAEAGILIGELDAIAEVVSMFYLAAYGFINFACLLESWASSDFRPQFKISPLISLVGTISIFFAMVFLNLTAMLVAVLIIGAIFLYLVRKQIASGGEDGDIWDGVWTSVIRRGLYLLVNKETKARNWRPNIILFSGGVKARPHLIEFGKTLVGGLGFLSNFQLVEQESSRVTFSKPQQLVPTLEDSSIGFFTRQQDCKNIYEGMETIARTYGFSGLDPNTILLGWGGDAKDPQRFSSAIYSMIRLDYNILMMNYEKNRGFGNKERIDIWWRINEYSLIFTLKLIQFIQKAEDWRKVQLYLFIINEDELNRSKVQRFVNQLLEDMRIDAIVRIINYENPSEAVVNIIQRESQRADLVIMGLPRLEPGEENDFLEQRDQIGRHLDKTLLLIKASSYFQDKT
ncbi:MAG: amino acid permease, partial [Bacteroidota bacterium]